MVFCNSSRKCALGDGQWYLLTTDLCEQEYSKILVYE
jgi:hypothetical protein